LQYYTEWLPALLPQSPRPRAGHVVKCVQPVAWDRSSWLGRSLGRLLGLLLTQRPGPRWLERHLVRHDAEGFIRSLSLPASAQASAALAVWRVLELADIEEPELREFCAGHKLLPALVPEVLRGETSEKRRCLVSDNLHRFRLRS
jgi:hypothetical protein